MSVRSIVKILSGDTPGKSTQWTYYHIGPESATLKVYLQAALHADEQPGILILHHLLQRLAQADEEGLLNARFVLFPMVNPLAMGDIDLGRHQGRYHRGSGVNHNRGWPSLKAAVDDQMMAQLGTDATRNIAMVRDALRNWAVNLPVVTAQQQWRQTIVEEACDADYVFDLHCDADSLLHIFSIPQLQSEMQSLANRIGAAATLMAEDSGGGSFDEMWPAVWLHLARTCPDKALPLPVTSCTLEYRGQFDTFDALNRVDADNLYAYFQSEGLIVGEASSNNHQAPPATDLRATQKVVADRSGLLAYQVAPGDRVSKGDKIADLILLDGDNAFVERVPIRAATSGLVLSRSVNKYVWPGAAIAKIVGHENLVSAGDYLLED